MKKSNDEEISREAQEGFSPAEHRVHSQQPRAHRFDATFHVHQAEPELRAVKKLDLVAAGGRTLYRGRMIAHDLQINSVPLDSSRDNTI